MGKVLRVLVVLIALIGIAATVFAYKNYSKREALKGRCDMLEDSVIRLASTIEAVELQDVPQPDYESRDTSPVTSREIETPERSAFWDSYNPKLEAVGETPSMINFKSDDKILQLRKLYYLDPVTGKTVISPIDGKPSTKGEGTMSELLNMAYERAKEQYSNLLATRSELTRVRTELNDTIADLNAQKKDGRLDKATIEKQTGEINNLNGQLREEKNQHAATKEAKEELEGQVEELNDTIEKLNDEVQVCSDKISELEAALRERTGKNNDSIIQTSSAPVAEGVLTPGDKGKIVACNDEWKYAIIEFSPDFITELIGPQRDRALPPAEIMVRRPDVESIDDAFVTRLKLRQIIREKNLVIADIMADWQQKPVLVGDIVFN